MYYKLIGKNSDVTNDTINMLTLNELMHEFITVTDFENLVPLLDTIVTVADFEKVGYQVIESEIPFCSRCHCNNTEPRHNESDTNFFDYRVWQFAYSCEDCGWDDEFRSCEVTPKECYPDEYENTEENE